MADLLGGSGGKDSARSARARRWRTRATVAQTCSRRQRARSKWRAPHPSGEIPTNASANGVRQEVWRLRWRWAEEPLRSANSADARHDYFLPPCSRFSPASVFYSIVAASRARGGLHDLGRLQASRNGWRRLQAPFYLQFVHCRLDARLAIQWGIVRGTNDRHLPSLAPCVHMVCQSVALSGLEICESIIIKSLDFYRLIHKY